MAGEHTSVYLTADLAAAVKASGVPLGRARPPRPGRQHCKSGSRRSGPARCASPIALPPGEPCPGTVCSGPGCWHRDTARYGLRRLVLCTACAAGLPG